MDNFLNNISNRVEVMLHQEGASQNANDGGSTSTNQPGSTSYVLQISSGIVYSSTVICMRITYVQFFTSGRGNARRRARIDSYNINPEHLLTEFFNMTSRNGNDNGQV